MKESEKAEIRLKASASLAALQEESSVSRSWIRGEETDNVNVPRSPTCHFFDATGFCHIRAFASSAECAAMKQQMVDLVRDWNPEESGDPFGTDTDNNTSRGDCK